MGKDASQVISLSRNGTDPDRNPHGAEVMANINAARAAIFASPKIAS